jgi:anti-sigma B factor antagonist
VSSFRIDEDTVEGGIPVIEAHGYVDFDAAPRLKQAIVRRVDEGHSRLVVDLSSVGFIDSTGIGVLVGAMKRLGDSGGALVVVCPSEQMRSIFEVIGLDDVIPLHRSREHAVSALARAA